MKTKLITPSVCQYKIVRSKDLVNYQNILAPAEEVLLYSKLESKRQDWLLGRLAAKLLMADFLLPSGVVVNLSQIIIKNDQMGVPVAEYDGLVIPVSLSISHAAGELSVAALATEGRVGVDIEKIRFFSDDLGALFLNEEEKSYILGESPEKRMLLTTLAWSLKEAYLKAVGTGIRTHPRTVNVISYIKNPPQQKAGADKVIWFLVDDYVLSLWQL